LWLGSVLIKAARAPGNQILYEKGDYFDCCDGWYDDDGNVFNIEKLVFTKEDVLMVEISYVKSIYKFNVQQLTFFGNLYILSKLL
jgi:hypothetical protein